MPGRRSLALSCLLTVGDGARLSAARAATTTTPYARHGVAFVRDFLPKDIFEAISAECRSAKGVMKREVGSMAVGRLGRVLDRRAKVFGALAGESCERVTRHTGSEHELSEFPVEVRLYKAGSSMEWHRDDLLYAPAQCEVVLTIENSSDSSTEWVDASGELHEAWTPPNSALLVRAGEAGARHRVRELKRGERTIVKMVFAERGAERMQSEFLAATSGLHGLRSKSARALAAHHSEEPQKRRKGRRR